MPTSITELAYRTSLDRQVLDTARGVVEGSVGIVEAARTLTGISVALGTENEEPFISFQGIDSETDDFPLGDVRAHWNPDALAREDAKRERYEAAVRERVIEYCQMLIARYERLPV